ncbi:uracil-DNA glycosylase [Gammaproteobacteria bacterium]|jgi:DNA polymerase|nr:uracil-DNA glycosylase [Gammaproteobacteria bacterium]
MIQTEHQRRAYLEALGIDVWVPRDQADMQDNPVAAEQDETKLDWQQLREAVAACTRCILHESRTQTVFGVGDPDADWMIIGEAPGAEEDRRGEPFVGRAGKLLDEMLRAIGQKRESVFIANILKCRPPNNRDPKADEASSCRGYLERQIDLVSPKIILAAGRIAAQQLLGTDAPVGRLRGKLHHLREIPVVVTYHPAYLLRSPSQKRKAWDDLCMAKRLADGSPA